MAHFPSPGCLSTLPHTPESIQDHLLHYFGCIEISQRKWYLNLDNEVWKYERDQEQKARALAAQSRDLDKSADSAVFKKFASLAAAINAQYKRTDTLRNAIRIGTTGEPPQEDFVEPRNLVLCVEESLARWRASLEFARGIHLVQAWKANRRGPGGPIPGHVSSIEVEAHENNESERKVARELVRRHCGSHYNAEDELADFDLERDVKAHLIQYSKRDERRTRDTFADADSRAGLRPVEADLADVRFQGRFPNQTVSMSSLFVSASGERGIDNLFDQRDDRIKYLHIPSNNMTWVEKVIATYFDEEPPNLSNKHGRSYGGHTRAETLLRPQFWRGRQYGTRGKIVHARHMRPLCERLSIVPNEVEDNPKNVVLFMPTLHWEIARRNETITRIVEYEAEKHRRKKEVASFLSRDQRRKERSTLPFTGPRITHAGTHPLPSRLLDSVLSPKTNTSPIMAAGDAFASVAEVSIPRRWARIGKGPSVDSFGRLRVHHPLGQYLMDVARLFEAMSTFKDQQMLEKYLFHDPPLHPRRTLDQSYYWSLKSTKTRDRDQVVSRGTSMMAEFGHRLVPSPPAPKKRPFPYFWSARYHDAEDELGWQWTGHWDMTDERGCDQCRSDSCKVSKLIMVDQLWMWVLDERTIITSFPSQYGVDGDSSGTHHSIRTRLGAASKNQIRSVYDIALIILDECSNTFFDRTKPEDSQPPVIDIFFEAIGSVTHRHAIAFQHVWYMAQRAFRLYRSKSRNADSSELSGLLLDLHAEGRLQQEVKDIIDELKIMLHICITQREMIKRFCKHVEQICDPEGLWRIGGGGGSGLAEDRFKFDQADGAHMHKKNQFQWFRVKSLELLSEVDDHIDELEGLKTSAEDMAQNANDLLVLKQQQASFVQAWESVKQAGESVRQGQAVMMFTVVTIIFLPLSFMSSIFGMNNLDFGSGSWTLGNQFKLMFPVSVGIIVVSVAVAFSKYLRAVFWCAWRYITTWLAVEFGLYRAWLSLKGDWQAEALIYKTEREMERLKEGVQRAKKARRERRLQRKLPKEW
ncbi:hypothetical protein B0T22DRAFT_434949 [Podospora appendiculata]|uniref:Uncharacterized protein n=1 Tax=Podospora appendiculata TaxID=314037 RepID=A0AAE0WYS6_9PEZI|nr:hypothetical protein B0T22DRAFT_434949 [Podospora appendiculata]